MTVPPLQSRIQSRDELANSAIKFAEQCWDQLHKPPHEDGLTDQEFADQVIANFKEKVGNDREMLRMRRHIYRISDGGEHLFSADSANEAIYMHAEILDVEITRMFDECPELTVVELDDETDVEITSEEGGDSITKTCRQWADTHIGMIGSSEF